MQSLNLNAEVWILVDSHHHPFHFLSLPHSHLEGTYKFSLYIFYSDNSM